MKPQFLEDVLSLVPSEQLNIGLHKVVITAKSTFGIDIVPLGVVFQCYQRHEKFI